MRSLIILEVEHGEDTDDLTNYAEYLALHTATDTDGAVMVNDYTVRVDLPECFQLEGPDPYQDTHGGTQEGRTYGDLYS